MIHLNFDISLKKGRVGETIIREKLEAAGWIVYQPFTKDKAHYFDILATHNKEKVIAIDVKTKARLNKWAAQGIDIRQYNEYKKFTETCNVPFYLVFVDEQTGHVHMVNFRKLKNPISVNAYIIAWGLNQMKLIFELSESQKEEIKKYSQRSYKFSPV